MADYTITTTTEDDALLAAGLAKENAIREAHNATLKEGEEKWPIIPNVPAYVQLQAEWTLEKAKKDAFAAAYKAALAKLQADPASLTAEDKAVLGIK